VKKPVAGISLEQVGALLSSLERDTITPSQVRTILVLGPNARAMEPKRRGEQRLFSAEDVAIARLVLRLRKEGVTPVVSRVIVATLREELVRVWRHGDAMALAVIGMRGLIVPSSTPRLGPVAAFVPLPSVWARVEAALASSHHAGPADRRSTSLELR
jgi:hypothetical protein